MGALLHQEVRESLEMGNMALMLVVGQLADTLHTLDVHIHNRLLVFWTLCPLVVYILVSWFLINILSVGR